MALYGSRPGEVDVGRGRQVTVNFGQISALLFASTAGYNYLLSNIA